MTPFRTPDSLDGLIKRTDVETSKLLAVFESLSSVRALHVHRSTPHIGRCLIDMFVVP